MSWAERWASDAATIRKGYAYRQKSDVANKTTEMELAELMDRYRLAKYEDHYAVYLFPALTQV